MRIDHIEIRNFKGFEHWERALHAQFNLIVGSNGSGKTTLLDALAVAAGSWFLGIRGYDTRHITPSDVRLKARDANGEITFESRYPVRVQASGEVMDQPVRWERSLDGPSGRTRYQSARELKRLAESTDEIVREGGMDITLPLISYYGTGRLWQEPRASSMVKVKDAARLASRRKLSRFEGYRNSVDPRLSMRDLVEWMARQSWIGYQQGAEPATFRAVKTAILACVEGARNLYFDPKRGEVVVLIDGHDPQPFFNLSDGQRSMLAMVGDLAQKAARLNPALGDRVLLETPGIVLIDELDLHLHPRWQRRLVEDLRNTFPKVQFVCTTHSPFLVQALRSGDELLMLEGQPTAHPGNLSIDEVAQGLMGVPAPELGLRYQTMRDTARAYLEDLAAAPAKPGAKLEAFRKRLAERVAPYADNPAFQALLEMQRAAKLGS